MPKVGRGSDPLTAEARSRKLGYVAFRGAVRGNFSRSELSKAWAQYRDSEHVTPLELLGDVGSQFAALWTEQNGPPAPFPQFSGPPASFPQLSGLPCGSQIPRPADIDPSTLMRWTEEEPVGQVTPKEPNAARAWAVVKAARPRITLVEELFERGAAAPGPLIEDDWERMRGEIRYALSTFTAAGAYQGFFLFHGPKAGVEVHIAPLGDCEGRLARLVIVSRRMLFEEVYRVVHALRDWLSRYVFVPRGAKGPARRITIGRHSS